MSLTLIVPVAHVLCADTKIGYISREVVLQEFHPLKSGFTSLKLPRFFILGVLMAKKSRFQEILEEYSLKYDLETLNSPNDRANLEMLINNQVLVERLQGELLQLTEESAVDNIDDIKNISNAMRDIIERNLQIERALALDRKTRKSENSDSIASYITNLKVVAQNFLEKRLIKVYCPDCKVLVARFAPVMDHTAFHFETQCSQCGQRVIMGRKAEAEGVFFDIKDYRWRKQYLYEVVQPDMAKDTPELDSEEELFIIEDEDGTTEKD